MQDDIDKIRDAIRPKWAREVLMALESGPLRYSDLLHGITQSTGDLVHGRTLTTTLRTLERQHYIDHSTDYRLSAGGKRLVQILLVIEAWSRDHPRVTD